MVKGFQKPANTLQELQVHHPGIINSEDFSKHFELHCYKPSPDLQPFVVHIWTQRFRRPLDPLYKPPLEILAGPNTYLFFTQDSAFVHGVARHAFSYNPLSQGVIAGVKFRPGGLYPFLRRPLSELDTASLPIMSVFPAADEAFRTTLLMQSDELIVTMIEDLLRSIHPKHNKNIDLIAEIVSALAADSSLQTVSATAQNFGMSERSLQLLFQTYVGVGVKWVITRRRLLQALSRIRDTPQPTWAEVAAELGYSSQSHFSREFKEVSGMAPSEYAKALTN